ncbi:molybdopterin molybdotransferase MoeA [Devosia rhodophyticola]|uniref:Molybdopterin molybdenumtransferase n=1 Tax=Devosia rhodophyticola TaxID=3026423 RepID=A0ABY7YYJ0_9HYPH|nr:gephyrin-like molybdotransferase Glp [Devosia rhodophyticola]WDR05850.1 molybdopterin molybdotransferase MoeA [Devosia rhodophyticola]
MSLLPVEDAIAAILGRVPAPTGERVGLAEANGRVLFEPLIASHNQPPFNASAMDGYAVRAGDMAPGKSFSVIGVSQAGAGFSGSVGAGQCVRIFTGAPVPEGADAVIMQEEAEARDGAATFSSRPPVGRSIRPIGNDFATGRQLMAAGDVLGPYSLALAAAANKAEIVASRRPRIAVLATGDELQLPGQPLGPDEIVASNNFGLVPMFAPYAQEVLDLGIARDDRVTLRAKLVEAFDRGIDMLVTTGGASVGDHDIVQEVLKDIGVELDFWRINMRPGKPLMFGTRGSTLVFGLPGNPVSAMVTAALFIKPALRQWLGMKMAVPTPMRLPLAGPTPPNSSRRHFMRARLVSGSVGMAVEPISQTDSGHTSSLAQADVLIFQPENDPGQPVGTVVDCVRLDAF